MKDKSRSDFLVIIGQDNGAGLALQQPENELSTEKLSTA
jgi:hypothetical protein